MEPAFKDDLMASAIVALAHRLHPAPQARRTVRDALAVMAMPAETAEAELHRMLLLQTVMGFGPLAHVAGRA